MFSWEISYLYRTFGSSQDLIEMLNYFIEQRMSKRMTTFLIIFLIL